MSDVIELNDAGRRALWDLVVGAFRTARTVRGDISIAEAGVRRRVANARSNAYLDVWCTLTGQDDEAAHDDVTEALQGEHDRWLAETVDC